MGLRPTNRDESPVRGPRLFNELRWAFDRAAAFQAASGRAESATAGKIARPTSGLVLEQLGDILPTIQEEVAATAVHRHHHALRKLRAQRPGGDFKSIRGIGASPHDFQ